jgi:EmrB/QacA subfamily drug resistance transporter
MSKQTLNASPEVNKTLLMAITMVANFFNPFTGAAVNIALPKISAELHLDAVAMSWVTMAYLLASAVMLVPLGKVADRWGRKTVFLIGNIVFMIASFLCAAATTGGFLIAMRVVQGIGTSMMVTTSMALLMSAFPPKERGKVIGMNVASVYLGLSAAPVLGGVLTQSFGWRSLFLINGSVSVFVALAIFFAIKTEWKEPEKGRFDLKGALIYVFSLILLMYGFSKMPDTPALIMTAAGLIGLYFFIRMEIKVSFPVLDVTMFRDNIVYALSNLSAFINYAATFAVSFVLSLYLQYGKHLTPRQTGMLLMIQPVLMALVSVFSGRLSDRFNPKLLASTGMGISVIGLSMLAFLTVTSPNSYILSALGILGFGFGLFSSPNTNVVMSSVEHKHYGVASATLATMRNLGMMFSMAIASLSVHVFIGNRSIDDSTILDFMHSSKVIFLLFSALCLLGVFTSLRNSTRKHQT